MTTVPESPRAAAGRSLIAADVAITGDIGSEGTVEIAGSINGKVAARNVVLAAEGQIKGMISADTVELRGRMEGKISCNTLTLRSAAQVQADINYKSVVIESGAQIEGRLTRSA